VALTASGSHQSLAAMWITEHYFENHYKTQPLDFCLVILAGNYMGKLWILAEFWEFLRYRKKYWLAPIIMMLLLLAALIILSEGSALAPFVYTLF